MQETKAAIRYARSLFTLAVERKELEVVSKDMELIDKTIKENHDLGAMLQSPIINSDKKEAILKAIFAKNISTTSAAFLDLIVKKRREMYVAQIARQFVILHLENNGIEEAQLTTAHKIDEAFRKQIIAIVEKQSGNSKVELEEIVDPKVIGGFILRFSNKQIDTSVERDITLLRREFEKNLYVKDY
jgi:F-type H+-transporting ATPase subunit delta